MEMVLGKYPLRRYLPYTIYPWSNPNSSHNPYLNRNPDPDPNPDPVRGYCHWVLSGDIVRGTRVYVHGRLSGEEVLSWYQWKYRLQNICSQKISSGINGIPGERWIFDHFSCTERSDPPPVHPKQPFERESNGLFLRRDSWSHGVRDGRPAEQSSSSSPPALSEFVFQRPTPQQRLPIQRLHIDAAASRTLPRPCPLYRRVQRARAGQSRGRIDDPTVQRDRERVRAGRPAALQRRGMGEEHSVLPRPPTCRSSVPFPAQLERTVRSERRPVFHPAPHRATLGGRRIPRRQSHALLHGCRTGRRLHGSRPDIPGSGGQAESTPRRFRRIQLSQSNRPFQLRYAIYRMFWNGNVHQGLYGNE